MTQDYDFQVGAIGAVITLTCRDEVDQVVNLSTATLTEVILRGPVGPAVTRTATVPAPASNGQLRYVTVAGDLQYAGTNRIQGHVRFADNTEFWTSELAFEVGPNL